MKKLWAYFYISLILAVVALLAQTGTHSPSVLDPRQLPPIVGVAGPAGPPGVAGAPGAAGPQGPVGPTGQAAITQIWGEVPQPGIAPNTWTLSKPVMVGINVFWNGMRQSVGGTYVFTSNGTGGTLLTLTPAAVALNYWNGTDLVADYQ